MKVKISKGTEKGTVEYDEETRELLVVFPDSDTTEEIEEYLTKNRLYRIPESQVLDDYREELANPTDSLMHMELALSCLWNETEVFVNW